jgi:dTDP-4-amino-4,6-dideoxygalactose transaminase
MIWRCDLAAQYDAYADEIDAAIREVLRSGRYVLADQGQRFEREFAAYVGVGHGVGVNSGTDALLMGLWALGVKPGDEVITTPFTAIPTYSAIRHVGAVPVFVDIDPETLLMDLRQVAAALTPRTRAVVPVHLFGSVVDIEALREIVGPDVRILEDCAQSHGATLRGRMSGTFGDAAAFSFYPTKNLGAAGDGGLLATHDAEVAQFVRLRRMYGMISKDEFITDGINTRLDELQAAVLRVKLKYLDAMNRRRRELAARYAAHLDSDHITPVRIPEDVVPNYHVYCAFCRDRRDELVAYHESQGIQSNVLYPMPRTQQKGHRAVFGDTLAPPQAAFVAARIIALPFYPEMNESVLDRVAERVNAFYREGR